MKNILKTFGTGVIFLLMSIVAACFGSAAYFGFASIQGCSGWEAVGLAAVGLVLGFMCLYVVYGMGVIPLSTIDDLKKKLSKLEDTEDD